MGWSRRNLGVLCAITSMAACSSGEGGATVDSRSAGGELVPDAELLALPVDTCEVVVDGTPVNLHVDLATATGRGDDLSVRCGSFDLRRSPILSLDLDSEGDALGDGETNPGGQLSVGTFECLGWVNSTSMTYNTGTPWFSPSSIHPPLAEPTCAIKIVSLEGDVVRGTFWASLDPNPNGSSSPRLTMARGAFVLTVTPFQP